MGAEQALVPGGCKGDGRPPPLNSVARRINWAEQKFDKGPLGQRAFFFFFEIPGNNDTLTVCRKQ
jgi:hypothetical protein